MREDVLEPLETTAPPARMARGVRQVAGSWAKRLVRWTFILVIAFIVAVVPIVYYRYSYTHGKRLREVSAGKLYRSGCMTAAGFRDAIERLGIKTIINLMDEAPDPSLRLDYFSRQTLAESALCAELNVNYIAMTADLVCRKDVPGQRPKAIDRFLEIMDDPANYPVLVHCKAGLHRTGCLIAVFRMEYDGWSPAQALHELRHLGFGEFASTSANDYIVQYILAYQPRKSSIVHRPSSLVPCD